MGELLTQIAANRSSRFSNSSSHDVPILFCYEYTIFGDLILFFMGACGNILHMMYGWVMCTVHIIRLKTEPTEKRKKTEKVIK